MITPLKVTFIDVSDKKNLSELFSFTSYFTPSIQVDDFLIITDDKGLINVPRKGGTHKVTSINWVFPIHKGDVFPEMIVSVLKPVRRNWEVH